MYLGLSLLTLEFNCYLSVDPFVCVSSKVFIFIIVLWLAVWSEQHTHGM